MVQHTDKPGPNAAHVIAQDTSRCGQTCIPDPKVTGLSRRETDWMRRSRGKDTDGLMTLTAAWHPDAVADHACRFGKGCISDEHSQHADHAGHQSLRTRHVQVGGIL